MKYFLASVLWVFVTVSFSQEDEDFQLPVEKKPAPQEIPLGCQISSEAQFPGGYEALSKFLIDNIRFPDSLTEEVRVVVRFIINEIGKAINVEVIESNADCPRCEQEAIRVIEIMPDWKPEKIGSKPIKSTLYIPIKFTPDTKKVGKKVDEETFIFPEIQAEYPGGYIAMNEFIRTNLCFPKLQESYEGKVYCRFTVSKEGEIKNVKVLKGIGIPECDSEAVRIIRSFPNWIPGRVGDSIIESIFDLPIKFNTVNCVNDDFHIVKNPEILAEFSGTPNELMKIITHSFTLSEDCITGSRFIFRFLVSKKGVVTRVALENPICPLTEKVEKAIIAQMPLWKPAFDNGEAVDSYFVIPMTICFTK